MLSIEIVSILSLIAVGRNWKREPLQEGGRSELQKLIVSHYKNIFYYKNSPLPLIVKRYTCLYVSKCLRHFHPVFQTTFPEGTYRKKKSKQEFKLTEHKLLCTVCTILALIKRAKANISHFFLSKN